MTRGRELIAALWADTFLGSHSFCSKYTTVLYPRSKPHVSVIARTSILRDYPHGVLSLPTRQSCARPVSLRSSRRSPRVSMIDCQLSDSKTLSPFRPVVMPVLDHAAPAPRLWRVNLTPAAAPLRHAPQTQRRKAIDVAAMSGAGPVSCSAAIDFVYVTDWFAGQQVCTLGESWGCCLLVEGKWLLLLRRQPRRKWCYGGERCRADLSVEKQEPMYGSEIHDTMNDFCTYTPNVLRFTGAM